MENTIEINGNRYRFKGEVTQSMSRKQSLVYAATTLMGGHYSSPKIKGGLSDSVINKLKKVNLVDEFGKIENKKSNLSFRERNWIVSQFNKIFEKVENE